VNRKAETVRRKNRETGTTGFRSAFGFVHAAIAVGEADHPLMVIYAAIRDGFQAKSLFLQSGRRTVLYRHPPRYTTSNAS